MKHDVNLICPAYTSYSCSGVDEHDDTTIITKDNFADAIAYANEYRDSYSRTGRYDPILYVKPHDIEYTRLCLEHNATLRFDKQEVR